MQALVSAGCKIYAVHPLERDLETVFREIVTRSNQLSQNKDAKQSPEADPAPISDSVPAPASNGESLKNGSLSSGEKNGGASETP